MEIETLAKTVARRFYEVLMKQLAQKLKTVNFETLNEPSVDVNVQALEDTGKHTSTSRERYSCLSTLKVEAEVFFDILD